MTFRGNLRAAAQALLLEAGTIAGQNVFLPRDWPLNSGTMPAILIQTPGWRHDDRTEGLGSPQFWSQVRLDLHCQLESQGGVEGAALVEDQLEILSDQVETELAKLIVFPPQLFRRIVSVEGSMGLDSTGKTHVGTSDIAITFEYANDLEPTITDKLDEIRLAAIQRLAMGGKFGAPFLRTLARQVISIPQ